MVKDKIKYEYSKNIEQYFSEMKHYKTLTQGEEKELGERIRKGDRKALNKLVQHNLKFVVSIVKNYRNRGIPFEDLIAEGNMGLIRAAEKFDGTKNTRFITYAVWWIKSYINELFRKDCPEEVNVDDYVLNGKSYESEQNLVNEQFENELVLLSDRNTNVDELINCLRKRERDIIVKFYGLNGSKEMNLDEIGKSLNLSNERIRQIKDVALIKIKTYVLMQDSKTINELKSLL